MYISAKKQKNGMMCQWNQFKAIAQLRKNISALEDHNDTLAISDNLLDTQCINMEFWNSR